MGPLGRHQTVAFAFLFAATLASFWAAARLGSQMGEIAAVMAIAAGKVIVVLRRFMESDRLALPLKLYFYAWAAGCAALIITLAYISTFGSAAN